MPGPALEGREDALQRHPELTEIDLKDDDVVCGRLDPVLEEDPPAGPQLEEAGDSFSNSVRKPSKLSKHIRKPKSAGNTTLHATTFR